MDNEETYEQFAARMDAARDALDHLMENMHLLHSDELQALVHEAVEALPYAFTPEELEEN